MSLLLAPVDGMVTEIHALNEFYVEDGQLLLTISGVDVYSPCAGKVYFRVDRNEPRIEKGDILAIIGVQRKSFVLKQKLQLSNKSSPYLKKVT